MVMLPTMSSNCSNMCNSEQSAHNFEQKTALAVPIPILWRLEQELVDRKILSRLQSDRFYPLWFTAESQRNHFLWRKGLSLSHREQFEFIVCPGELVQKRLFSIQQEAERNHILKVSDEHSKESAYLTVFQEVWGKIAEQLCSLLELEKVMIKELGITETERETILL